MKSLIAIIAGAMLLAAPLEGAWAADRHLFYVHGCCIKDMNDPKVQAYEKIVRALQDDGFDVVFDIRTADVGDNDAAAQDHAARIAGEVNALLARGVAPADITVAGYSLGAMTTLLAAGLIANPDVNFVLLAGCPVRASIPVSIDYSRIKGRVLAVIDAGDDKFGSCSGRLPEGVTYREVVLNSGVGHAVFRLDTDRYMKLWKEPLLNWAQGKAPP